MLQCVAEMCSKRRHVRLLCLLGTSCKVSPSAATGGTSECAGAFWGRKNYGRVDKESVEFKQVFFAVVSMSERHADVYVLFKQVILFKAE